MAEYKITLTEIREKKFLIEAESESQAMEIAQCDYDWGRDDYIFTDDDIVMCECRCNGEVNGR